MAFITIPRTRSQLGLSRKAVFVLQKGNNYSPKKLTCTAGVKITYLRMDREGTRVE